jgi:hypothetical protein
MTQDNLTVKQLDKNGLSSTAVFLPAISGFYATFVGKQRDQLVSGPYVDPARFPTGLTDMEQLNWLNSTNGLFPYKWSLYSAGHANLDLAKQDWSEDMVRNREPGTFMLGDSGGFQIAKGLWEGDWKANSGCAKAQKKRDSVLKWLDGISDYGMILDIPTWVIHDKKASAACGITTLQQAVDATKFNNEYFMANRKGKHAGGTKLLNVLQGDNHGSADTWYDTMKQYCDPVKYPNTHFDGWAMGGQNMCDVHLVLKRLVALQYDNLLQPGVHDWMHFLGTSKLEWAVLLTVIQKAVRKYVNPQFTISFDCASPFLATANGQVYYENVFDANSRWSYRMASSADDKKYSSDTRKWADGVIADNIHKRWKDSPISNMLTMKDICIYKPGVVKAGVTITPENFRDETMYDVLPDTNKNGKWGKTSWDSFSYALLMGHNVWMHLTAVQEANQRFDLGERPAMMQHSKGDYAKFEDIIERIFSATTKEDSLAEIEKYGGDNGYWTEIVGTRGNKGKKAVNASTQYNVLFDIGQCEVDQNTDDSVQLSDAALDQLEQEQQ